MQFKQFVSYDFLPASKLTELFNTLDKVLRNCARLLNKDCDFVRDGLLEQFASIASGSAKFKTLYDKQRPSRVDMRKYMINGYTQDDFRFLMANYSSIIHSKRLPVVYNRYVYYEVLAEIFNIGQNYLDILDEIDYNHFSRLKELHQIEEKLKVTSPNFRRNFSLAKKKFNKALNIRFKIISPFFRYVLSIAGKQQISSYQTTENFQSGVMGLIRASLLYNNDKGTFGNYAKFWVKQAIYTRVYDSFLISIPGRTWKEFKQLEQHRENYSNIEELSAASGFSVKHIKDIYERVLLSQVGHLEYEDDEPKTESILETVNKYGENKNLFSYLNKEELDLFLLMFGNYKQLEACNNITKEEIKNEVLRQKEN